MTRCFPSVSFLKWTLGCCIPAALKRKCMLAFLPGLTSSLMSRNNVLNPYRLMMLLGIVMIIIIDHCLTGHSLKKLIDDLFSNEFCTQVHLVNYISKGSRSRNSSILHIVDHYKQKKCQPYEDPVKLLVLLSRTLH